jgi:hypothetical protein
MSIAGPTVSVRIATNFPAFKSGFYVVEVVVSTPESSAIALPKCAGHERACPFQSNVLTDALDCDGLCHPGLYTMTVAVYSHSDGTRLPQSPSYLAWVGGESGKNLSGHPLARGDPRYPGSLFLTTVVQVRRTSYD